MKKALFVVLSLSIFTVSIHSAIGDWFKKTTKKGEEGVKKTTKKVKKGTKKTVGRAKKKVSKTAQKTKSAFQNPAKTAEDAGYAALRKMGVNVPGIMRDVQLVQTSVGSIGRNVSSIQSALDAPASPKSKAPIILNKIKDVKDKAKKVEKDVGLTTLKNSISSPAGVLTLIAKVSSESAQTHIRNFSNAYSALISELDSVQTVPLLSAIRATVLNMAGIIDAILRIRSNAGSLAEYVTEGSTVSSVRAISGSLHRIAGDLNIIMQAGGTRKLGDAQAELIGGIISNINKIGNLTRDITATTRVMGPNMTKIQGDVRGMMREKDRLLSAATSIPGNLKKAVESKLTKVTGAFNVPAAAVNELKTIMRGIRGNIDAILRNLSNALMTLADSIDAGTNGIGSFKRNLNFDLVPPQGRRGFDALPTDVRGLSSNVDRLRRSLR